MQFTFFLNFLGSRFALNNDLCGYGIRFDRLHLNKIYTHTKSFLALTASVYWTQPTKAGDIHTERRPAPELNAVLWPTLPWRKLSKQKNDQNTMNQKNLVFSWLLLKPPENRKHFDGPLMWMKNRLMAMIKTQPASNAKKLKTRFFGSQFLSQRRGSSNNQRLRHH